MAQMTDSLAQDILDGAGVTRHEIEQLAYNWLKASADSGEAVAWQFRNVTEEGPSPVWHDIDKSKFDVLRNDPHAEVRELFTQPRATALDVRAIETLVTRWLGMRMACTSDEVGSSQAAVFHYCAHDLRAFLSQRVEKGNDKSRD